MAALPEETKTEAEKFSRQTKKQTSAEKINPLFNFISDEMEALQKEGIEIQTLSTKEGRPYFLIRIFEQTTSLKDAKPAPDLAHHLISGYECTHRHLRIDQFYVLETSVRGSQGYAFAHYTEQYKHPCIDQAIDVHVYFNRQAGFENLKVKVPKGFKENLNLPADNAIYEENAQPGKTILNTLMHKFRAHYLSLATESTALERELSLCNKDFTQTENRNAYIAIATRFIAKMNEINRYNDLQEDRQGDVVAKVMQKLQNYAAPDDKKASAKDTGVAEDLCPEIEDVLRLESELNTLKKLSQDLNNRIEVFICIEKLKDAQCELMLLKNLSTKLDAQRQAINTRINDLFLPPETIDVLLDDSFKAGNVTQFKRLFSYQKNKTHLFGNTISWIYCVVNEQDKALQKSQIEICDYLFNIAEVYSYSIFIIRLYMAKTPMNFYLSVLATSLIKQDFECSAMLLRHGVPAHSMGVSDSTGTEFISLLRFILTMPQISSKFLDLVLNYHDNINATIITDAYSLIQLKPLSYFAGMSKSEIKMIKALKEKILPRITTKNPLESLSADGRKNFLQQMLPAKMLEDVPSEVFASLFVSAEHQAGTAQSLNDLANASSDLIVALHTSITLTKNYDNVILLQERSNIFSLALAIATLLDQQGIAHRQRPFAGAYGLRCVANRDEANSITASSNQVAQTHPAVQYMIYPTQATADKQFKVLKTLCQTLANRCQVNPADMLTAIQKLQRCAEADQGQNNNRYAKKETYWLACILLMSHKPELTLQDCHIMMQCHCNLALLLERSSNPAIISSKQAAANFANAFNITMLPEYAASLQNTGTFTIVKEGLSRTLPQVQSAQILPQFQASSSSAAASNASAPRSGNQKKNGQK